MISIANFYWILFENLLAPVQLNCKYFFPFGTTDQLIANEYGSFRYGGAEALALFHFDQEPIYPYDDSTIAEATEQNRCKWPRILANSEHSFLKKKMCKQNELLDWYFFYHGFAALDWYRDAEYLNNDLAIDRPFINLNHLVKHKRSHRMSLLARLVRDEVVDVGMISFHANWEECRQEIKDPYSEISDFDRALIEKYLVDRKLQPLIVDQADIDATFSARFGVHEYRMKQRAFLHVVTETVFYDKKLHLTEKVFQPIVHGRPFVLVAAPGNLQYLKSYGFKTFDRWIDESYDQELDNVLRLDKIAAAVKRISSMSMKELRDMLAEIQPILEFNKRHFFSDFRRIITHELVDNFDQCLRLWNNGRVNYVCPRHPDLEKAKSLLLQ